MIRGDYLIDDCVDNLIGKVEYMPICMATPYNKNHSYKFFTFDNWKEIYKLIITIERKIEKGRVE